mmetsp:Transcript_31062/g.42076  ORF Transcript_31062/g.42076 Transcript_31062/m.42076 type:complete len:407 (-) Transcript_31062:204-1424(-)|eukprot:CAMPEP_0185775984 /NCGR_PEP_ID=MMETSP1174-20130828/83972_1 /TAXON_ID=35687 /ORGANISM="Dictyocha speculum, Strain CCMP1381" /LENGTH=406 /DNA_ID=CAMNT_0028463735 /DNA_START=62 /DNA_END=1282 /DNA_ORIENTATION=-
MSTFTHEILDTTSHLHDDGNMSEKSMYTASGLPLNFAEIAYDTSAEFNLDESPITRSVALEVPMLYQPQQRVEDHGALLHPASMKIFAPPQSHRQHREEAPKLPIFWKVQSSSFRTRVSLSTLREELVNSFADKSIQWTMEEGQSCHYACNAFLDHEYIEFDVRIFSVPTSKDELLVDIQLLRGCRFAFTDLLRLLESCLSSCPGGSLTGSFLPPPPSFPLTNGKGHDMLSAASEPLLDMLNIDEESTRDEACRAVACLSAQPDAVTMFFDGESQRETALLTAMSTMFECTRNLLALSMMANLAAVDLVANVSLASARLAWFINLLDTDTLLNALEGECPHVRREALRTLASLSEMDNDGLLCTKIVRNSVWSRVKFEAEEGLEEIGTFTDMRATEYARRIVASCA